jgi:hypothetical protein
VASGSTKTLAAKKPDGKTKGKSTKSGAKVDAKLEKLIKEKTLTKE